MNDIVYKTLGRTSSGQIITGKGVLKAIIMRSVSNAAVIDIYDGTSNAGTWLGGCTTVGGSEVAGLTLSGKGTQFDIGLYLDIVSGTVPKVKIEML